MRIVDFESNKQLNDVALYLTAEEIEDLRAFLSRLSDAPAISKVYLSEIVGSGIEREITFAIAAA